MKKRSRKSDAKNIGKSSKKSSKIDAKTMKKPSSNTGIEQTEKKKRLAKALRENLKKRKSQSRIRISLLTDDKKGKKDG